MNCPVDGQTLVMSERSGVEIDYCPDCRGVWLDRGELDKILERATAEIGSQSYPDSSDRKSKHSGGHGSHSGGYGSTSGKRRGGWLGELFD